MTKLVAAGAPTQLTADSAAHILRRVRPRSTMLATLRRLASDLIGEVRRLDRRIATVNDQIATAVEASGTTLTKLCGVGNINAGKVLSRVGSVERFPTAAAFASYNGTAPIEVSSGDVVRHRLSRPVIASSTTPCTSWPSLRSAATRPVEPTTSANATVASATRKRSAV